MNFFYFEDPMSRRYWTEFCFEDPMSRR